MNSIASKNKNLKQFLLKFIINFCILLLLCFFIPQPANAGLKDEFTLVATTTAQVDINGMTKLKTDFLLTNLTATKYLPEYVLEINQPDLKNISLLPTNAKDKINFESKTKDQSTIINVQFATEKVGEGKYQQFTLEFEAPTATKISGKTLTFKLPLFAQASDFSETSSTLIKIPVSFGEAVIAQPSPHETKVDSDEKYSLFTYLGPQKNEVLLKFGQNQLYKLQQFTHLINEETGTVEKQIIIPSNTPWQRVSYIDMQPQPAKINLDQGGNWVASYQVPARTSLPVSYTAEVELNLQSNSSFIGENELPSNIITYSGLNFVPGEVLPTTLSSWQTVSELNSISFYQENEQYHLKNKPLIQTILEPLSSSTLTSPSLQDPSLSENESETEVRKDTSILSLKLDPAHNFLERFFGWQELKITNLTGQTYYQLQLAALTSDNQDLKLESQISTALPPLLPFQTLRLIIRPVPAHWQNINSKYKTTATIEIKNHDQESIITNHFNFTILAPQLAILALGIGSITILTGSILVLRSRKKSTLRR